jgi:Bacterial PH domain
VQFELAPASTGTLATLYGIALVVLAVTVLLWWIAWGTSQMSVAIKHGSLQIHVPMYGREIPIASLDLAQAAIVDLDANSQLRPKLRTNGIGVPGLGVGWFRLKDGSKALLALTRRSNVLYLPTRDGYALLISVNKPQRVLEQLRAA